MGVEFTPLSLKDAKTTGREYKTSDHFLLECVCPHCQGPQWHAPGAASCIYCGDKFSVTNLKIVARNNIATEAAGKDTGPEVA